MLPFPTWRNLSYLPILLRSRGHIERMSATLPRPKWCPTSAIMSTKTPRAPPWALFCARWRRWARAAGRGAAQEPPLALQVGPSQARFAPLVRLLLLSDPGSWCSGTRKHLRHLPGLCSAHGGAAGHEQRGADQRKSPLWRCRCGQSLLAVAGQVRPPGAAAAPL